MKKTKVPLYGTLKKEIPKEDIDKELTKEQRNRTLRFLHGISQKDIETIDQVYMIILEDYNKHAEIASYYPYNSKFKAGIGIVFDFEKFPCRLKQILYHMSIKQEHFNHDIEDRTL